MIGLYLHIKIEWEGGVVANIYLAVGREGEAWDERAGRGDMRGGWDGVFIYLFLQSILKSNH